MEGLAQVMELGRELGLSGEELMQFVERREAQEREKEEKRIAREEKKETERLARETERMEREQKAQLDKMAREERMKERELKQKELEISQLEHVAKLKLQLAEREIELEELKRDSGSSARTGSESHSDFKAKLPKLPAFCEGKDNMDSYLKRFERFAENASWPREKWATNLSALLQGKALDVYSRLSPLEAINYDILRDALLKRYQLTEEGFRLKFRNSKQEVGETASQFIVRLSNYLSRWMELGKVSENFEGLRDLMLREQFLAVSHKNLVVFLKERKISSITEMTDLADQYLEAHAVSDNAFRFSLSNIKEIKQDIPRSTLPRTLAVDNITQPRPLRDRVCYNCGKKDHFIKNCPYKGTIKSGANIKAAAVQADLEDAVSEVGTPAHCELESEQSDTLSKSVATCIVLTPTSNHPVYTQDLSKVEAKPLINDTPLVSIVNSQDKQTNMPVTDGFVGSRKVRVLRDSGCNAAIIKETFVTKDQMKNKSQVCVLADGTKRTFPVASVYVDTPYYTGNVDVLCMANPVYDLVLGNINGVRSADNADGNWHHYKSTQLESVQEICAVETRAQKAKKGKLSSLHLPKCVNEFTKEDIAANQMQDNSLSKCWSKAETREEIMSKGGSVSWFVKESDLLYRKFRINKDRGKSVKQLLVPEGQRQAVLRLAHDSILAGHLGVRKTKEKVLSEFWWPGLEKDIRSYCRSCDVCQKTVAKGRVSALPLGKMPVIDRPFSRIALDLI